MLLVFYIVLAVALVFVPLWLLPHRRNVRRFLDGRTPLPDGEFLRQIDCPTELADRCLAIRKEAAAMCGMPDEMIFPHDKLDALLLLPPDGADLDELLARLDGRFATAGLRNADLGDTDELTFGQLTLRLAPRLPSSPVLRS